MITRACDLASAIVGEVLHSKAPMVTGCFYDVAMIPPYEDDDGDAQAPMISTVMQIELETIWITMTLTIPFSARLFHSGFYRKAVVNAVDHAIFHQITLIEDSDDHPLDDLDGGC